MEIGAASGYSGIWLGLGARETGGRVVAIDSPRVAKPAPILDPADGPLIAVRLNVLTRKSLGGLETDLEGRVLGDGGAPINGNPDGVGAPGVALGYGEGDPTVTGKVTFDGADVHALSPGALRRSRRPRSAGACARPDSRSLPPRARRIPPALARPPSGRRRGRRDCR